MPKLLRFKSKKGKIEKSKTNTNIWHFVQVAFQCKHSTVIIFLYYAFNSKKTATLCYCSWQQSRRSLWIHGFGGIWWLGALPALQHSWAPRCLFGGGWALAPSHLMSWVTAGKYCWPCASVWESKLIQTKLSFGFKWQILSSLNTLLG